MWLKTKREINKHNFIFHQVTPFPDTVSISYKKVLLQRLKQMDEYMFHFLPQLIFFSLRSNVNAEGSNIHL